MSDEMIAVNNCEPDLDQEWRIAVDGYFKNNAERQMLNDDMSQEAVDTIFSNAARMDVIIIFTPSETPSPCIYA